MTRQKKSRKVAEVRVKSKDTRSEKPTQDRRKKAPKGQKSGTRNSLVEQLDVAVTSSGVKKDPKHGSKKPIPLTGAAQQIKVEKEITHSTRKPSATLNKAKLDVIPPDVELTDIESDETLIALVERVEDEDDDLDDEVDPIEGLKSNQWDDLLDEK